MKPIMVQQNSHVFPMCLGFSFRYKTQRFKGFFRVDINSTNFAIKFWLRDVSQELHFSPQSGVYLLQDSAYFSNATFLALRTNNTKFESRGITIVH